MAFALKSAGVGSRPNDTGDWKIPKNDCGYWRIPERVADGLYLKKLGGPENGLWVGGWWYREWVEGSRDWENWERLGVKFRVKAG